MILLKLSQRRNYSKSLGKSELNNFQKLSFSKSSTLGETNKITNERENIKSKQLDIRKPYDSFSKSPAVKFRLERIKSKNEKIINDISKPLKVQDSKRQSKSYRETEGIRNLLNVTNDTNPSLYQKSATVIYRRNRNKKHDAGIEKPKQVKNENDYLEFRVVGMTSMSILLYYTFYASI